MNQSEAEFLDKYPEFNSFEEMRDHLLRYHPIRSLFKMILLIASTTNKEKIIAEFKSEFDISIKDNFYKIRKIDKDSGEVLFLGYFIFVEIFKDISSIILFTYSTSKQVNRYIYTHFVEKNSLINNLWITHKLTMDLIDKFMNFETIITYIKGYYSPLFEEKSSLRPEFYREITYKGIDAIYSYYELKKLYGINLEKFEGKWKYMEVKFSRKKSQISYKRGDLDEFIEIAKWLFQKSNNYLKEIRKFKKKSYESEFLKREYLLSNNLFIEFDTKLSNNVLNEIIRVINSSPDLYVINTLSKKDINKYEKIIEHDRITENYYRLELLNRKKEGVFLFDISSNSAEITQVFDTNFIGVFPILDILDYTHPENKIYILN